MRKSPQFAPKIQERAVRMVFDVKDPYPSQWAAIESIAGKIGCPVRDTGFTCRPSDGLAPWVDRKSRSLSVRSTEGARERGF